MAAQLLRDLPMDIDASLVEQAQVLDNFYIPARYPDSHPEGAPFDHFGPLQSRNAIDHAHTILEFARTRMADDGGGP
jgi:HEPN domain-containing protein